MEHFLFPTTGTTSEIKAGNLCAVFWVDGGGGGGGVGGLAQAAFKHNKVEGEKSKNTPSFFSFFFSFLTWSES